MTPSEETTAELRTLLTAYLRGQRSADDIYSFELERHGDDDIAPALRERLARLSLVAAEVDRGWAPNSALVSLAREALRSLPVHGAEVATRP